VIAIDTLSLRLPAGFEHRAERIGRLVGDAIADLDVTESRAFDRLALPAIHVERSANDAQIATAIAHAVRCQFAPPATPTPTREGGR